MEGKSPGYARKAIREKTIPYRPAYTKITKKVTASILLQQIVHYWEMVDRRPFYKFRAPCGHDQCRDGDSWTEDLGFTVSEFDSAIKTIGTKITKGKSKDEAFAGTDVKNLVIYWTDSNRVTWYELNQPLFDTMTDPLYEDKPKAKSEKLNYIENKGFETTRKTPKSELHTTENTSEKTTEILPPEAESVPKCEKPTSPPGKKEPREKPPQLPGIPTLEPDSPGATYLFQQLRREYTAKKQRAPAQFKTLAQKEKFAAAEEKANGQINEFVDIALEAGILPLKSLVSYVAACANGDKRKQDEAKSEIKKLPDGRTHVIVRGTL